MARLNWTPQAKDDLITIAEYIAQDSQKYARIEIQRLRERARQAAKFPNSGRVVPELQNPQIRELILGNYRIIDTIVDEKDIDILTVHHSARMLDS